jgi:hypothetical protein
MVARARYTVLQSWFVGALALGGCAYQPDSFAHARQPFDGVQVTIDCLDLSVGHESYPSATSNVVAYWFGNRCDSPVVVDLASARVVGMASDGSAIDLQAFDPMREIRTLLLDARAVGHEAIDYPSSLLLKSVCVDAATIAHVQTTQWVCVDNL